MKRVTVFSSKEGKQENVDKTENKSCESEPRGRCPLTGEGTGENNWIGRGGMGAVQ